MSKKIQKDKTHLRPNAKSNLHSPSPKAKEPLAWNGQLPTDADLETDGAAVAILVAATSHFSELGGNYRERIHLALATVYSVALHFEHDPDAWQDFVRQPNWEKFKGKRPTINDCPDKLQPTIRFAAGFDDKNASKTASKYCAALSQPYRLKVPPSQIPSYLEEGGGIEELARKAAKARRAGDADLSPSLRLIAPLDGLAAQLLKFPASAVIKLKMSVVETDGISTVNVKLRGIKSDTPGKTKTA